jgi:hypothetical protein
MSESGWEIIEQYHNFLSKIGFPLFDLLYFYQYLLHFDPIFVENFGINGFIQQIVVKPPSIYEILLNYPPELFFHALSLYNFYFVAYLSDFFTYSYPFSFNIKQILIQIFVNFIIRRQIENQIFFQLKFTWR